MHPVVPSEPTIPDSNQEWIWRRVVLHPGSCSTDLLQLAKVPLWTPWWQSMWQTWNFSRSSVHLHWIVWWYHQGGDKHINDTQEAQDEFITSYAGYNNHHGTWELYRNKTNNCFNSPFIYTSKMQYFVWTGVNLCFFYDKNSCQLYSKKSFCRSWDRHVITTRIQPKPSLS